ncbi:hypothetical protein CASFOL_006619 [Castilleja foliolosa]|uniref:RING-CH-type domain-containing protein n=1 Tax=Castilleja foliolosa TaxID=1961234 RepID=A0ABD3EAT5_9LAMI
MASLQQNEVVVDIASSNTTDGCSAGHGGGGQLSTGANEIVGVLEIDGNSNINDNSNVKGKKDERRESSVSECSVEIGPLETKVCLARTMGDCRICYLSLDITNNQDSGIPIELGCSCKDDLAAAHKQCAEAWFKIKGNKICEICGSIAQNVVGVNEAELVEQLSENDATATATSSAAALSQSRNFWQGHKFLNFLLACMVFAFVISWLFHFNVPS